MTTLRISITHSATVALLAGLAGCGGTRDSTGAIPPQASTHKTSVQPTTKMVQIRHAPKGAGIITSDGAGGEWFAECASTIARVDEKTHKFSQFQSSYAKTSCGGGVALGRNGGGVWFTDPNDNKLGFVWLKSHKFDVFRIPTANSGPASIIAGPDNAMWFTESAPNTQRGKIGRVDLSVHPYKISEYALPYNGGKGQPYEIVPGADGALWFTDPYAERIGRITTDGQISSYADGAGPVAITAGPDGALWFTEDRAAGYLGRIDPYTHKISSHPIDRVSEFSEITSRGTKLWFTGRYQHYYSYGAFIVSYDLTSYELKYYGLNGSPDPEGITPGSDCRVWFTEPGIDAIGNLLPPGRC